MYRRAKSAEKVAAQPGVGVRNGDKALFLTPLPPRGAARANDSISLTMTMVCSLVVSLTVARRYTGRKCDLFQKLKRGSVKP